MLRIKKLDLFIIKNFLQVFLGAFFICLFVFMMQFTWRYVEELIGKGLTFDVLVKFFWYMGITLIPMTLPLAILLGTLITFGNMGERLELLAMRTAGVSLIRIISPLIIIVIFFTFSSFYFQNNISPNAQVNLRMLIYSMKQTSPTLEIPEGVFYNGIPNLNLYVGKKNNDTNMLYNIIIYKTDRGIENAQIVLADSGKLEMSQNKLNIRLQMWSGEQFENLRMRQHKGAHVEVPYDRETFVKKTLYIDFDSNFYLMDAEMLNGIPSSKNMASIESGVDSMEHRLDSVGHQYYKKAKISNFMLPTIRKKDSTIIAKKLTNSQVNFDSILANMSAEKQLQIIRRAIQQTRQTRNEWEWRKIVTDNGDYLIRRYNIEWHQKITLSLACMIFFFIGAPLGAIIRKGGLGMPTVISVLIFIFYYLINTSGMKLAKDGTWSMVHGMWISTAILTPLAIFLTYKSNKDSVVFNFDAYINFMRRIIGLRTPRRLVNKEVIIENPNYITLYDKIEILRESARSYYKEARLLSAPNYYKIFFKYQDDKKMEQLQVLLEEVVEKLSNTRDIFILNILNKMPYLYVRAHITPLHKKTWNIAAGIVFPIGILLWFRIWRFRFRLFRDLRTIVKCCEQLNQRISNNILNN